ncbi:cysteine proteinase [Rickenella mellea]|uniref:Ubiquitin carboxyl-terminal hydrolase n=1 Tax=Rickenella mellea TaxID=50990 RepID=A0A4Y7QI66_9AGAM|nr:cysteine proteinase [Rickenella mellea]
MDADAQTTIRNDSSSRCRTSRSTSLSSVDFHLSSPPRRPLSPNHLTTSPVAALHQTWIISTRRPSNPLDAFGITISPLANPPPHILAGASRLPSPPHRPKSPASTERPPPLPTSKSVGVNPAVARQAEDLVEATTCSTPRTDVPSPTSSTPQVKSTLVDPSLAHNDTNGVASTVASSHTSDNATAESSGSPNLPEEHPPVVKKSWASLLRSGSTSGLPTSSVVGVSIPAESKPNSAPTQRVAADQRSDLLALLTSGPRRNDGISHIRPRGLVNTGNICFANAVLQVLVYCSPFYRLFSDLEKYLTSQTGADPSTPRSIPLVEAYVEFLKEFKPKGRSKSRDNSDEDDGLDSFIPTYMYDAMKEKPRFDSMRGGHQEDAEEFLGFLLDALEEELLDLQATLGSNSKTAKIADEATTHQDGWVEVGKRNKFVVTRNNKSVESPITKIFGGKFRSTLKVVGQRDSVLVEDWRALQLDIQPEQVHNVEDALRHISFPQSVQVSSVTKGGAIVDATQHVLVESLPAILVLHLKRFLYDTSAKGVVKIGKHVAFRPELEFPSEIMSPLRRPAHPIKFKLFGVLYHHGQSASGGHYTLDVLHPNRNADLSMKPHEGWIRIDDELVSDLRTNDVFGDGLDDRCAYLLFYKQLPNRT